MHVKHPFRIALITASLSLALTACAVSVVDEGDRPAGSPGQGEIVGGAGDGDAAPEPTTVRRCDGELIILDDEVATRIEGSCSRLILNTTGSHVETGDVDYLEVIGDGNTVRAGAVDKLLVNGTGNLVNWSGSTPAVTDVGADNVLKAG